MPAILKWWPMSKKTSEPKIVRRKISDYLPDNHNANKGSERGLQMLEDSLSEDGAGRSVVVDGEGRIVAGNKTMEAAQLAGIVEMIEVETEGDAILVHKRKDWNLDDPQGAARRYAYRDNRVSEVSLTWDANQIAADVAAGVDLSHIFTESELRYVTYNPEINTPSLDELSERYGENTEHDFWPIIRIQVSPTVYEQFQNLMTRITALSNHE